MMSTLTTTRLDASEADASQKLLHTKLVQVLRAAYPHERFPDAPYERTADALFELAKADRFTSAMLESGLSSLDKTAVDPQNRTGAYDRLQAVAATAWFRFVRANTIKILYNDPEVWKLLGWEGASFDKGGYLNRGFNDLDWLPDPRIEEYDGPDAFTEQGPLPYRVGRKEGN